MMGKRFATLNNGLNHGFPNFRAQIIQLGSIIPWHSGAVVSVIDILHISGVVIDSLEKQPLHPLACNNCLQYKFQYWDPEINSDR